MLPSQIAPPIENKSKTKATVSHIDSTVTTKRSINLPVQIILIPDVWIPVTMPPSQIVPLAEEERKNRI